MAKTEYKSKYKAIKIDGLKYDEHRYLMEQHLGRKLDSKEVVHHINGDPRDNRLENLQVMSLSEHGRMHGKHYKPPINNRRGYSNVWCRKLTNEQVDFIREHYIPGDREFGTRALGRKFGVCHQCIMHVIDGTTYRHPS